MTPCAGRSLPLLAIRRSTAFRWPAPARSRVTPSGWCSTPRGAWFVLADLYAILGINNPRQIAGRLNPKWRRITQSDTVGRGLQQVINVSEPPSIG
jgi:hypothetical protein